MSTDKSQPSFNLKQRITGAVVLVALAVIIVPLVLDFRTDYNQVITVTNIPPKPDNFKVEVYSFEKDIVVPIAPVEEVVQAADDQTQPQPLKTAIDAGSIDQAHAKDRINELNDRLNESGDGLAQPLGLVKAESWVVQLASLSQEKNALILRDRVRNIGLAAFVTKGKVDGKTLYRVLVGPKILRSDAERLQQQLVDEIKLTGLVLKYQR